jgi:hypothetical protein
MKKPNSFFKTLCLEQLECRRTLAASVLAESSNFDPLTGLDHLLGLTNQAANYDDYAAQRQSDAVETRYPTDSSHEINADHADGLSSWTHAITVSISTHVPRNHLLSTEQFLAVAVRDASEQLGSMKSIGASDLSFQQIPASIAVPTVSAPTTSPRLGNREDFSADIFQASFPPTAETGYQPPSMIQQFDHNSPPFVLQPREGNPPIDRSRFDSFRALDTYFKLLARDHFDSTLDSTKQFKSNPSSATQPNWDLKGNLDVGHSQSINSWVIFYHEPTEFGGAIGLQESSPVLLYAGPVYPQLLELATVDVSELVRAGDSSANAWVLSIGDSSSNIDRKDQEVTFGTNETYFVIGSSTLVSAYVIRQYRVLRHDGFLSTKDTKRNTLVSL